MMKTPIAKMVRQARGQLAELTGLDLASTVSIRQGAESWCVLVEVVEKRSIPDSQDILATYELTVDGEGNVENFARVGMRRRADVAAVAAGADI